jgi:hypothetical protein
MKASKGMTWLNVEVPTRTANDLRIAFLKKKTAGMSGKLGEFADRVLRAGLESMDAELDAAEVSIVHDHEGDLGQPEDIPL